MNRLITRAFCSDAGANGLGAMIRSISRMIASVLIVRAASAELFGTYIVLIAIETLVVCAVSALCIAPVPILVSGRGRHVSGMVIRAADRMQLYVTASVVVVLSPLCLLMPGSAWLLGAFSANLIALAAMNARRSSSTARFLSRRLLVAEVFIGVTILVPLMLADQVDTPVLGIFWWTSALAMVISCVGLAPALGSRTSKRSRRIAKRLIIAKGIDILSGSVALNIQSRIQPILIGSFLGPIGAGLYGGINMFASPLRLLSMSVRSVALPRFSCHARSNTGTSSTKPFSSRSGLLITCVTIALLLSLLAWPISDWVVRIVLGEAYTSVSAALPIAIFGALLALLSTVMVCEAQAIGRTRVTAASRWIAAGISIAVLAPCMMLAGVVGVFLSVAIGELVMIISMHRALSDAAESESRSNSTPCDDPLLYQLEAPTHANFPLMPRATVQPVRQAY